jgi:hypothetical protein
LTDDRTHDVIPAKVTRYYLYEKKFNMLEYTYYTPDMGWEFEMSSVQEVYEAIIASRSMTFDSKALALHVTHSDSAFYI